MKYILLTILLVGVLLLTACGGAPAADSTDDGVTGDDTQATTDAGEEEQETTLTSITKLLEQGKAMHCSVNVEMDGMATNQDIYIDGDKYRVDMLVDTEEMKMESGLINDGEWLYSWNSQTDQGMKMSIEFIESQGGETDIDTDMEYNYACTPWRPQSSMFNPPSDVEFIDFGEFVAGMQDAFPEQ